MQPIEAHCTTHEDDNKLLPCRHYTIRPKKGRFTPHPPQLPNMQRRNARRTRTRANATKSKVPVRFHSQRGMEESTQAQRESERRIRDRLPPGDWRSKRPVLRRHRRTRDRSRSECRWPLLLEADGSLLPERPVSLVQVHDRLLDLVAHRLRLLVRDVLRGFLHLDRPAEPAAQHKHCGKP